MRRGSLILLYFIPLICLAQIPSEDKVIYTKKDGLSSNTVEAIVKDVRGFLWIGTAEGLTRFDGAHFTQFFSDPNSDATLTNNSIYDILEYQPGKLLIATSDGLSVLNTFTSSFENEKITLPALKKGSDINVKSLFKDRKGQIYINYGGEIDVFSNDLQFLYRLTDTEWGRPIKGIIVNFEQWLQDSKGRIWIPSDNLGICILDEQAHQVYYYDHDPLHYGCLIKGPLRSFYYDEPNGKLYMSYLGGGLQKYDLLTGKKQVQYFDLLHLGEGNTINAITRKDDRLICGGSQRIFNVDPITLQYEPLYQQPGTPGITSFLDCAAILNDTGNIWIGTETKGLVQLSYRTSYVHQIALPYTLPIYPDLCSSIFRAPNGFLYFAYGQEGLVEADAQKAVSKLYQFPGKGGKNLLVQRICTDSGDNILLGTNAGFFSFNTQTKTARRSNWLPSFTDTLDINYLWRDKNNNLWVSFKWPNALGFYDSKTRWFHYYPNDIIDGKKVFDPKYTISRIFEDKQGNIWMVSSQAKGEIAQREAATGEWKTWPASPRTRHLFAGKELTSIYVDGPTIWTGNLYGLGLVQYNYHTDSTRRYSRKDGLLSDNFLAINADKKNNLFICTVSGIDYLNTTTHEIRTLLADDGVLNWGYAFIQYYDSIGDRLIYGLTDRIVIAQSRLWEAPVSDSPQTYIDNIRVDNEAYPYNERSIRLNYSQRNISISFTSINYNPNAAMFYAYKMTGVDKDWNLSQQVTTSNYSNLSPGDYTFMVKARDQSGIWGPVNSTLHITILPAIWQMTWFWLLIVLLIVLLVIILVRRRIIHIKSGAELKQKLAESEMMALRAQMNPHFIFNCLNAIDNLVQTQQSEKATTYLNSFARLIRSLLENSKNNLVPFYKDFESLKLYLHLEQFRTSNKFSYELDIDQELINGDYKVPPLIVQPFVENAIQHGLLNKQTGERNLFIRASVQDGFIQYIIKDNGVGRARAEEIKVMNRPEHRSYGMQITRERLQLHNRDESDITITDLFENGSPSGTKIEIRIKTD